MNIAVDARQWREGGAGKGRYVGEIIKAISKIDSTNKYFILVNEAPTIKLPSNFTIIHLPKMPYFWIWRNLNKLSIDLFFSPTSYLMCLFSRVKTVIVVHDLAVFLEPKAKPKLKTKVLEKIALKRALRKSIKVIAVSVNTKNDILNNFIVNKDKIEVIYPAGLPLNGTPDQGVLDKYGLNTGYVLYVGTIEPRKNLDNLIRAYGDLPISIKEKHPLVLVGKRGWNSDYLDGIINSTNTKRFIREVGFIPDNELLSFYHYASIFAYPSWYEGFGLPVLEAMSYGLPVITSNISSLPEVAGLATVLISPDKPEEITLAITDLLKNKDKALKMKKLGLKQAEKFTWRKSAVNTINLFDRVGKTK